MQKYLSKCSKSLNNHVKYLFRVNLSRVPIMKNILVVDDVEVCRYTVALAVDDCNLNYKGASTMEDAKEYLKNNKVDVIFLDWHLKKEQSTNSLDELRNLAGQDAIICMMSAIEQEKGEQLVANHQVQGFLAKPIHKDTIVKFLREQCHIH